MICMKKIFVVVAILFCVSSYAQVTNATLTASGLTCSMCSKAIYEALKKVNTIEQVSPLAVKVAFVTCA